jgi:transposase InsO family protein
VGIPPPCRNQREPTAPDTPHATAASSVDSPSAILAQNARSNSRRIGGLPGDRIDGLPFNVTIHPGCLLIDHLHVEVLRRPVDSAQYTSLEFSNRLADWQVRASYGSTGDCYDNAAMESTWAAIKREIRHIHGPWEDLTRSQLRTILFEYIEVFYNRRRHQARLGHRTPAETYAASRAA